ncbi:MAG TPA: hypothetical protein PKD73_15060 [Burkholderiaceae bacterium]|nr:hypothetical protein [Burkholderiaceae bacterium]
MPVPGASRQILAVLGRMESGARDERSGAVLWPFAPAHAPPPRPAAV